MTSNGVSVIGISAAGVSAGEVPEIGVYAVGSRVSSDDPDPPPQALSDNAVETVKTGNSGKLRMYAVLKAIRDLDFEFTNTSIKILF